MDRSSYSGQLLHRLFCWKRLGTKRSHVDAVSVHPRIWGGYRLGGCSLKRIEQAGNKILVERTRFLWWNTDLVIYSNKLLIPRFDSFSAQLNLSIFQMTQINYCRASNFTSSRLCFFRRKERIRNRPLASFSRKLLALIEFESASRTRFAPKLEQHRISCFFSRLSRIRFDQERFFFFFFLI